MKINFSANGLELTSELEKYANRKVSRIARRVPRGLRSTAGCHVVFAQAIRKGIKFSTCTITLAFDGNELKAQETTQHMYAALDIATVQIEQQLKDCARKRRNGLLRRHFHAS